MPFPKPQQWPDNQIERVIMPHTIGTKFTVVSQGACAPYNSCTKLKHRFMMTKADSFAAALHFMV